MNLFIKKDSIYKISIIQIKIPWTKVFDNFYNINTNTEDVYITSDKEYCPDYAYEKDMLKSFEEFKDELVYDGFNNLSRMIRLSHFYLLFQYGYNPCF